MLDVSIFSTDISIDNDEGNSSIMTKNAIWVKMIFDSQLWFSPAMPPSLPSGDWRTLLVVLQLAVTSAFCFCCCFAAFCCYHTGGASANKLTILVQGTAVPAYLLRGKIGSCCRCCFVFDTSLEKVQTKGQLPRDKEIYKNIEGTFTLHQFVYPQYFSTDVCMTAQLVFRKLCFKGAGTAVTL